MSQLGTQREPRTILGLLREHVDGVDGGTRRRRSFKERIIGCCGAHWRFRSHGEQLPPSQGEGQECVGVGVGPTPAGSGMNLAAALAAERQLRGEEMRAAQGTPWRVSLMRLLEETEAGGDKDTVVVVAEKEEKGPSGVVGNDSVCCVCMGRKKGAAFIPCGHTFCRVCSRELWLNRGSCPLCNRSILEILDIF